MKGHPLKMTISHKMEVFPQFLRRNKYLAQNASNYQQKTLSPQLELNLKIYFFFEIGAIKISVHQLDWFPAEWG